MSNDVWTKCKEWCSDNICITGWKRTATGLSLVLAVLAAIAKPLDWTASWIIAFGASTVIMTFIRGEISAGIERKAKKEAERGKDDLLMQKSEFMHEMVQRILDTVREHMAEPGSDHDLKVTLFTRDQASSEQAGNDILNQILAVRYRAGGIDVETNLGQHPCTHTFPTRGQNMGVAGTAYHTSNAVEAIGLPDLNDDSPETDWTKYADLTFVTEDYVRKEYNAKKANHRKLPRLLVGVRIKVNKKFLGVVVVDSVKTTVKPEFLRFVTRMITVLEHPLSRLS